MAKMKTPNSVTLNCDAAIEIEAAAEGQPGKRPSFAIAAYNGGALRVGGFYRPIVIDLAGLRSNATIPILLDHDHTQIVGQANKVKISKSSVSLSGVVTGDDGPAGKVISHAKNGFKWAASVGVGVERLEYVDAGDKVSVNGKSFQGPIAVARAGRLGEVSFVAVGADETAAAEVAATAATDKEIHMSFEKWLEAKGFDAAALTDEQKQALQAAYDTEQGKQPDSPKDPSSDAKPEPKTEAQAGDVKDVVAETQAEVRAAAKAETDRIAAIRKLYDGKYAELEAKAIEEGWTADKAKLELMYATAPKAPAVRVGSTQPTAQAIEASMCIRAGIPEADVAKQYGEKVMNAAVSKEIRHFGLISLIFAFLKSAGYSARPGQLDNEAIQAALQHDQQIRASSGFSTISLSGILSNVANKAMLQAYQALESIVAMFCRETDVSDFKTYTRYRMTLDGGFDEVGPDGELKHTTVTEDSYTNRVKTYGRIMTLTRKMMVDDDLGAFLDLPRMIGRKAALAREKAVFTLLLDNTDNFYGTGHKNYITGVDTNLSVIGLTSALQKLAEQTDASGDPVMLAPKTLVVPPALHVVAKQLMTETRVNEASTAGKPTPANNPHVGIATPAMSPYLTSKPKEWYLFANPLDVAALEIAYLRGQRAPTVEMAQADFNILGMQFRGVYDFGVGKQDHRATVKSKGEA